MNLHLLLSAATIILSLVSNTIAFAPHRELGAHHTQIFTLLPAKHWHRAIITERQTVSSARRMTEGQAVVYGAAVATTFGMQTFGFAIAYLRRTETFYDIFGGANYMLLALLSAVLGSTGDGALPWAHDPRKVLATVLFACSRGWLLLFLAWRAHERGGDSRFDEVLGKGGGAPQPLNFFVYWMVQGLWVMLISMPMLFVNSSNIKKPVLSVYDILCGISFAVGILIEVVADCQKAMWVKRGRQGVFCDVGVWKFSRHPNYFGEILQWWCLFLFSRSSSVHPMGGFADPLWWAGIVSPLFTMQILLAMEPTGICNAEGKNLKRYYDNCRERYTAYRENTSILIPFVGYGNVPKFLKRTLFFDFERYEYKPRSGDNDVGKSMKED